MSYVDAGYAVALSTLLVYALSLIVRRRRWERAYEASQPDHAQPAAERGERS